MASVVVDLVIKASERVDEALEIKPLPKTMVVVVAFSLVESLVNGQGKKVVEREPAERLRPVPIVRGLNEPSAPMYGIFERRAEAVTARLVVVAAEVVAVEAVKWVRVDEPVTKRLPERVRPEI